MIQIKDLTQPYKEAPYNGIAYSNPIQYDHISRYRNLRQVTLGPNIVDKYSLLETVNPLVTNNLDIVYHVVELSEENRLDLIANKFLGSSTYSWVIAYFNQIDDGYTVREGQTLIIPRAITALFTNGEILAPINYLRLNLGEE